MDIETLALPEEVFDQVSDGLFIVNNDGIIQFCNEAVEDILGYGSKQCIGESIFFIFPELESIKPAIDKTIDIKGEKGTENPLSISIFQEANNNETYFLVFKQIQNPNEEDQDVLVKEQLEQIMKITSDGIVLHRKGNILKVDETWEKLFGYKSSEVVNTSILEFIREEDHPNVTKFILSNTEDSIEVTGIPKNKNNLKFKLRTNDEIPYNDEMVQVISFRNITKRKRYEKQVKYLADHDDLTGLSKRQLLQKELTLALTKAQRDQSMIAVLNVDINNFNQFNQTLGHAFGDELLKEVAVRIKQNLKNHDFAARIASDEFVLVIQDIQDESEIADIAKRIVKNLEKPITITESEVSIFVSMGICCYPNHTECAETLLKNAGIAMKEAKKEGTTIKLYNPSMKSNQINKLTLENELRKALKKDELFLHYQPQVDLKTGKIVGMESLIRWKHDELGFISPGEFIPIAEANGLIVEIGEWVLQTACAQNKLWQEAGYSPITVSVNLSARQFIQSNLVDTIKNALNDTKLDPGFLYLEITESIAMENEEQVFSKLNQLQSMGVKVSIDDFGTGYSSFNYLKKFPLNNLKIDRSFIQDSSKSPQDQAIVKSMVAVAKSLGLKVIAEGAETEEHIQFLRSIECDQIQGFYFSKPLSASDFEKMLKESKTL